MLYRAKGNSFGNWVDELAFHSRKDINYGREFEQAEFLKKTMIASGVVAGLSSFEEKALLEHQAMAAETEPSKKKRHIQLWLNGHKTVDYTESDESIEATGIIGVQIHGGPPSEAWYRNITIIEL